MPYSSRHFLLTFFLFLVFNVGQVVLVGLGTLRGDTIQSCPRVTKSSQGLSCITTVHCLVDCLDGLGDYGHKTQMSTFSPFYTLLTLSVKYDVNVCILTL